MKKYCITFAGVPGSSKSTIGFYLSWKLGLPIFSNDHIRNEVTVDLRNFNEAEYLRRRDQRLGELLESDRSFIFDASIDRSWEVFNQNMLEKGYKVYVVSLDLSLQLLNKLYELHPKAREPLVLANFIKQHENFLDNYANVVGCSIDDHSFDDRLSIAFHKTSKWIRSLDTTV